MQRLPVLTSAESAWRLPLCDLSSAALLEALAGDADARQGRLASLIATDASLALWGICRAAPVPLRDVASLARWLAGCWPQTLRWISESEGETETVTETERHAGDEPSESDRMGQWIELAQAGLAVAVAARESAAAVDAGLSGQAYLLGLVHGARQWLGTGGPEVSPDGWRLGQSCLPAWLVESLGAIDAPDPGLTTPASCVAAALDCSADATPADPSTACRWQTEIPPLARSLPALIDTLRRKELLETDFAGQLEREKLAAMKEFAYGAGHEINNPLANISTRAQTLLRDETDPERRRRLATINSQAFRAHEMIADLMLYAYPPQMELAEVNLASLIDQVIEQLRPQAEEQSTRLCRVQADHASTTEADPVQLAVALKCLCINSLEALSHGGQIEISTRHVRNPEPSESAEITEIVVRDTGPGIAAETRAHLFDPFYSGREAGRGLGFGLSKVWRIVTEHGGRMVVESTPGEGAAFTIRLPAKVNTS